MVPKFNIGDKLKHLGEPGYGDMVKKNNGVVTVSAIKIHEKDGYIAYGFEEDEETSLAHWIEVERCFMRMQQSFEF